MTIIKTLNQLQHCTDKTQQKNGVITIACKLGLWSVSGKQQANVIDKALHHFIQCKSDGEYRSIIG